MIRTVLLGLALACIASVSQAAGLTSADTVAVMDFGTRPNATREEIDLNNAEYTTSEYVINGLIARGCFAVMEKDRVLPLLRTEHVKCTGLIDPDSARRIGELLHVKYIVYGNVANVSLSTNYVLAVAQKMVRAHVSARVMDVETGDILIAVTGDGSSRSNGLGGLGGLVLIGSASVSMESVHNAIAKAADDAAEKIAVKCGIPPMKKK